MELLYSMHRKPLKCEPPHFANTTDPKVVKPICTISICNIIAFTSPTELQDRDGDTWGGHVYVCDLDTPWDSYKVTSNTHPVSVLEWDTEGKQLLVATTVGEVSVFGQKDYLLNEWTCLYSASFPGEHILRAVFFHPGRRVVAGDGAAERARAPTLRGFGGVPCAGACAVSTSGLACALSPDDDGRARAVSDSLRAKRDHLTCASFAHSKGGLLLAAVSGRSLRTWAVSVRACPREPRAPHSRPRLHALAVTSMHHVTLPRGDTACITWCLREDSESLLVAGSTLTLWKLTERAHPVHKLFAKGPLQGSTTPGGGQKPNTDCFNTVVFQQAGVWPLDGGVSVASCRLPHAVLATPHAVHLINKDNPQYICSRPVVAGPGSPAPAGSPPKKTKYGHLPSSSRSQSVVSCVEISCLGGVCVAIDARAQLHVYRILPPQDIPMSLSIQQTCSTLEWALSCDCLDLLLTLKPAAVEPVAERLSEWFHRQPQHFQQFYFQAFLRIRTALYRVSPTGARSVSWLCCAQALCAAAADLPDLPDHQDLDKTLLLLESKSEWALEPSAARRVTDIALTALASLTHHHTPHGYELLRDPFAVTLLRKLLVLTRDSAVVGRLLARLSACNTPKPDLIEECLSVAAGSSVRVWEALPRCAVSAPHGQPPPHHLEYLVEPEALRHTPEPPFGAQAEVVPTPNMDTIRYMFVGGSGRSLVRWRGCARCGARALPRAAPARADTRYSQSCRCGGKWAMFSNV